MLQFERKFETCDDEDIALSFVSIMRATYVHMSQKTRLHAQTSKFFLLQGDTVYLIYSYHTEDPVGNEEFLQHQFQGSMTINLFGQQENTPSLPSDIKYIDVINYNVSLH